MNDEVISLQHCLCKARSFLSSLFNIQYSIFNSPSFHTLRVGTKNLPGSKPNTTSFLTLCVGTKKLLPSKFLVRCWMFTLLIIALGSASITAQSLQKIYSGLDKATSVYATQNAIYVVEEGKNRLLKLGLDGTLLETIGGRGSGDYEFSKPIDVDATNGLKIFVTDYNNRRVQVFDRRGQFLSSIERQRKFGQSHRFNPTQIAVNDMGEVFVTDPESRHILQFDMDYNLLNEFRFPSEIRSVDDLVVTTEEILLFDRETETLHRLGMNGNYIGFYPAEGTLSVAVTEFGIWMIGRDRVNFESKDGNVRTFDLDEVIQPNDVSVHRNTLFILSAKVLYKFSASAQ